MSKIDPRASVCPNCGKRKRNTGTWHLGTFIMAIGLVAGLLGLLLGGTSGLIVGVLIMLLGALIRYAGS
jgi:hypothetical protein